VWPPLPPPPPLLFFLSFFLFRLFRGNVKITAAAETDQALKPRGAEGSGRVARYINAKAEAIHVRQTKFILYVCCLLFAYK
jgi:hypothetical protein